MYTKVLIVLVIVTKTLCSLQLCEEKDNHLDISNGTHLSNGDIYFEGVKYRKKEYFLDENGLVKACICKKKTCIRKCCPFGFGYDSLYKKCQKVAEPFNPPVWDEFRPLLDVNVTRMFHFTFGKMDCILPEYRVRIGQVTDEQRLRRDGQLYIEISNQVPPWTLRGPEKYCIDTFVYTDSEGQQKTSIDALVCYAEDPFKELPNYILTSTCMLISCVFILATVAVYSWLPELRNLHGRVLMAYLLCLFVAFLLFATMQILLIVSSIEVNFCTALTFIIYFFLLSAFFWLNVMSFDIWWTFSGKRGLSLEKLSTHARFCAYAAYAFGVPTILTAILIGLECSELKPRGYEYLMPNIQMQGCFLYGRSKLIYLYGPIVVLCVANMIFFILTAVKIAQIKNQTSVLKSKDSTTHDQERNDQQRLLLYVKLFIVMGINWILEVISSLYPVANGFWWITDAYNVLIGLIIFIIFVCKRKIFRLMKKRYKQLRGEPMSRTVTTSTRTNSSRDDVRMSVRNVNSNSAGP